MLFPGVGRRGRRSTPSSSLRLQPCPCPCSCSCSSYSIHQPTNPSDPWLPPMAQSLPPRGIPVASPLQRIGKGSKPLGPSQQWVVTSSRRPKRVFSAKGGPRHGELQCNARCLHHRLQPPAMPHFRR